MRAYIGVVEHPYFAVTTGQGTFAIPNLPPGDYTGVARLDMTGVEGVSRFLARSVLISAVNMQIQSARLLSLGVKWLVIVLTLAMALDHLRIGGMVVQLSFAILFGGIVLALALAVGLGSKEMVSRSWERQTDKVDREMEEHFHHL